MYGIVNKAIQEMIVENYGIEKWNLILEKSGIDIDFFISNEPYDDDVTYVLAKTIANEMKIPVQDVLLSFGEWWVLRTAKEKYSGLMQAGGASLKEFIFNLPNFHNRVMLIYPRLTPPEFKITNIEENGVWLHYYSKREGLQEFVKGILQGLAKMYETTVDIQLLKNRTLGDDHEIFKIGW
jgi:hypothetical protein